MSAWERAARKAQEVYGIQIDWHERFFICPECNEPIYECDWDEEDFDVCPICGFEFED